MINKKGRRQLALYTRRYLSGQISNFDLEASEPEPEGDDAIIEVFANGIYQLYSDEKNHFCVGIHAISKAERATVARWLLFLYSDYVYEWPSYKGSSLRRAVQVVTLSFPKRFLFGSEDFKMAGDFSIWPFIRRSDYNEALRHPPFFSQSRTPTATL